jgi:hypothetical protein
MVNTHFSTVVGTARVRGINKLLFVLNNAGYFLSKRAPPAEAALREGWDIYVTVPDERDIGKFERGGQLMTDSSNSKRDTSRTRAQKQFEAFVIRHIRYTESFKNSILQS